MRLQDNPLTSCRIARSPSREERDTDAAEELLRETRGVGEFRKGNAVEATNPPTPLAEPIRLQGFSYRQAAPHVATSTPLHMGILLIGKSIVVCSSRQQSQQQLQPRA